MKHVKLLEGGHVLSDSRKGQTLKVSDAQAASLIERGVAEEVPAPQPPIRQDSRVPEAEEARVLENTRVDDVLAKVESGEWDAGRVLELERAGKNRSSLISRLTSE